VLQFNLQGCIAFQGQLPLEPNCLLGGICRHYLVGELDVIKPDQLLDMRGESCPIPDIQARKTLENISPGEVLLVIVDYPLSGERIPVSIHKEGHEIIKKIADKYGDIKIYIRRRQNA